MKADSGRAFAQNFYKLMINNKIEEARNLAQNSKGDLASLVDLNVIVTMAPLLGLLGTIIGMISAFSVFNLEEGQAIAITGGVGEALIATATGLCVAIVSLAIHAYFVQRIDRIVTDMEQAFSLIEGYITRGE